jgi:hypothetical protein
MSVTVKVGEWLSARVGTRMGGTFVGVRVMVGVGVTVWVRVSVLVRTDVEVRVVVTVFVGVSVAAGRVVGLLLLPGQPVIKKLNPVKNEIIPTIRSFITYSFAKQWGQAHRIYIR